MRVQGPTRKGALEDACDIIRSLQHVSGYSEEFESGKRRLAGVLIRVARAAHGNPGSERATMEILQRAARKAGTLNSMIGDVVVLALYDWAKNKVESGAAT
jgi:hypothetical protein